jgi:transposase InsO family protein
MNAKDIPLPKDWTDLIRRAMIHAVSLAHFDIICAWSRTADSDIQTVRLKGEIDKLQTELALKENQLRIMSIRVSRIPAKNRPHYLPTERMEILNHKAACGWNLKQTAEAFQISLETIAAWLKRIDDDTLIKIPIPWNRYPAYLQYVTQQLKSLVPQLGKKKIAEYFTRSGLYLAATTVGRYIKQETPDKPPETEDENSAVDNEPKVIKSTHPGHTWTIDLTVVKNCGGLWTSWLPNALPQCWPFCWWVMVIVDHFSRKAVGFAVFREQPTSKDVTAVLDNAVERAGKAPKYIISDKGRQFFCNHYKGWCTDNSIKPRFGAVGKHGSIAITERFIKSLKYECTNLISVPLTLDDMRHEVALYFIWYNQYRPHEYLDARTPEEVYNHSPPIEKNIHKRGSEIPKLELELSFLDGRKHLPIIEFKKAS